jgi:hypothetical protein
MGTQDISRSAFDPHKHYHSVRMQMGRVIVDDDWNENERIVGEDLRRSRVAIIGPAGSSDSGFRVSNVRSGPAGEIDFDLEAGSFYLGGLRLELSENQTFLGQKDLLQGQGRSTAQAGRVDMVALLGYMQPVCAVEDSELFEVALGGPDTSTRMRVMQRALFFEDVDKLTCDEAWTAVLERFAQLGFGVLNGEHELASDARLQVSYDPSGVSNDLCTPTVAGGYLGAENQAIRVQIVDSQHLTWGFDNASPLYRVQLDATRTTVTMLTQPKDQAHWPLAGQVVEILPWATVLPNNEKIAELYGHLTKVASSFTPGTSQLTLSNAVPTAGFDDWKSRDDAAELGADGEYYYMRVWDRGGDKASPAAINFTSGLVNLGQTGLQVTLSGSQYQPGDFWVIAARPETPNVIVPWDLETGRAPQGLQYYVAPLALIAWPADLTHEPQVDDCRPHFRPLTQQELCCTYLVGDGRESHGDFDALEEAIRHLPMAGGKICLLPGYHQTNVLIEGRRNITIEGCGKSCKIVPRKEKMQEPIFRIVDSEDIALLNMDMITVDGTAIEIVGRKSGQMRRLKIHENRILAYKNAIHVIQGEEIVITDNVMRMLDKDDGDVAIFVLADGVLIERNNIGVVPPEVTPPIVQPPDGREPPRPTDPCADPLEFYLNRFYLILYVNYIFTFVFTIYVLKNPFKTLGGIQIGSGSEQVKILENTILGGAGNGITLGSDLDPNDFPQDPSPERAPKSLQNTGDLVFGRVLLAGQPLAGISLAFQGDTGNRLTTISDQAGNFKILVSRPGTFQVTMVTPGYVIESITTTVDIEIGALHTINVRRMEGELGLIEVLAFTYEVIISGNEISGMGLSGIGVPHLDEETLRRLAELIRRGTPENAMLLQLLYLLVAGFGIFSGSVVDLLIQENRIFHCLRNPFDDRLPALRALRGLGGISLGLCEDLVIRENRVEDNGTTHITPVCGIFVSFAQQAEIMHNQVLNNGPLNMQTTANPLGGQRGGIILRLVTARTVAEMMSSEAGPSTEMARVMQNVLSNGRHALRIHDNVVEQPMGQALNLIALGSVSVMNNSFTTQISSPFDQGSFFEPQAASAVGAAVNILNAGRIQLEPGFPDGNTLFSDNQTHLIVSESMIAQVIITLDDLGFHNNQSEVTAGMVLINTLLLSPTVRASNNRLEEPMQPGF